MSLFAPRTRPVQTTPAVAAQSPIPVAARSDSETAALAAEQARRFTRRRGRAYNVLSTPANDNAGSSGASRMLGAVART